MMKQLNSNRPKAMDKETFMQQYVLNRANTSLDQLNGNGAAIQAKKAWAVIQNELKKSEGDDYD
jgi:multidrug resistance efflux pump